MEEKALFPVWEIENEEAPYSLTNKNPHEK